MPPPHDAAATGAGLTGETAALRGRWVEAPDDGAAAPRGRGRSLASGIAHWGQWRSTLLLTALSALCSVSLTRLWLWFKGASEMGDARYIALFVSIPMSALAGGLAIALVITLEDTRRRIHELAMTDPLTGLRNRRHFIQWAQRELELANRHDLPLALVVLDIDHFKRINDGHGHGVGDAVLVELGRRCSGVLRGTDLLARWGGEEFIALLPNTSAPLALQLSERLRVAASAPMALPPTPGLQVTVSAGVAGRAVGTTVQPSLDALLQAADRALYEAKNAGRDRVRMAR